MGFRFTNQMSLRDREVPLFFQSVTVPLSPERVTVRLSLILIFTDVCELAPDRIIE